MGRLKNVRATKVKLSKVKALKFKRAANKSKMDVDVVEEHLSNMVGLLNFLLLLKVV
jgi:hypothetical protein